VPQDFSQLGNPREGMNVLKSKRVMSLFILGENNFKDLRVSREYSSLASHMKKHLIEEYTFTHYYYNLIFRKDKRKKKSVWYFKIASRRQEVVFYHLAYN
jgi:hypothetical protein